MPVLHIDTDALTTESLRDLCYALQHSCGEPALAAERVLFRTFVTGIDILNSRPHYPGRQAELEEMREAWRGGLLRRAGVAARAARARRAS